AKSKLGYLPEGAPAYADMTPRAFLRFVASARRMAYPEKRSGAVAERANIAGVLDQPIETLSKGFKRRVGLAQAILHDPPVLILDEPTDGLDPNQKHEVRAMIRDMAATKSIVISTHILEEVEAICGRAVIIARGRVVADATPESLLARAPDHNAVRITTAVERVDDLRAALEGAPDIMALDRVEDDGGEATLIARPRGGGRIAGTVANMLRAKPDLPISEIRTERGRLDDVFRALTAAA
ncbi:MAG: ABC transporter ATP-binding protein, partial [Pseudomonadota bacterium]